VLNSLLATHPLDVLVRITVLSLKVGRGETETNIKKNQSSLKQITSPEKGYRGLERNAILFQDRKPRKGA